MSKSTKKDASTPAPAAEGTAAEGTAAEGTAAEGTAATGKAAKATTASDGAQTASEEEVRPAIDDVKARFREALDRKRQVHAEGQGKGGHEAGKVSGAHGPAAGRRNFRRKSG